MNSKALRIILDILLIVVGIVFLVFGIKDAIDMYNSSKIEDNVTFSRDYSEMTEDNIYKYTSLKEANKMIAKDSGVLLIGKKSDPWMHVLVRPLNDIVKESKDTIYYLPLDDIKIDDKDYIALDEKIETIDSPTIIIFKDGRILEEYSKDDLIENDFDEAPIEYYTEERISKLKELLNKISDLE